MGLLERRQEDPEVVEHIRRIPDVEVSQSVSFPTPLPRLHWIPGIRPSFGEAPIES